MKKLIAAIVLALAGALAVPATATAATPCGADYTLTTSATTAAPGAAVQVTACFTEGQAGDAVTVDFTGGTPSNVAPAAAVAGMLGNTGSVTFTVTIPQTAANGDVFTASATSNGRTLSSDITAVVAPAGGGGGLAGTGVDAMVFVAAGGLLLLVGVGVAAAVTARRRSLTRV